jgi:regulator of protease activity HflC (stomatin/prohibitin superfamily)
MYISVVDPVKASYGVTDYVFAAVQLAQTTTRSVIGTLDLDRTFEERDLISSKVVAEVSQAGEAWGITVHRYEIKGIATPATVRNAMEQQVTAERERRALVARSEGEKQSRINRSEGQKMELINKSEGEMQRRINEAEGRAAEVLAIAEATATSIEKIADAVSLPGGEKAVRLQLTERYLKGLATLGSSGTTQVVLPADLTRVDTLIDSMGLTMDLRPQPQVRERLPVPGETPIKGG